MNDTGPLGASVAASRDALEPTYVADVGSDVEPFLARCANLLDDAANPFHHPNWLRAWYATYGRSHGRSPLLVGVREGADGRDAMLLPLVCTRRRGVSVVEFADAGIVDYVAPILAPDWHAGAPTAQAARRLWKAVARALHGHDVLRFDKLLAETLEEQGSRPNPLAQALPLRPSPLFGNSFSVTGDWEVWRRTLEKTVRKEIERCWRVFERSPLARFEHIVDAQRAQAVFETLERQQSERMRRLTPDYALDAPESRAFHRQVIAGGIKDGSVVLTALVDGEEIVSAMFGVANRHRYVGLRQSLGGDAWRKCSPARLLDERTAHTMQSEGRTYFDFGIGDYPHKDALRMTHRTLYETCVGLSWRGWPWVLAWRAKRALRSQPWLRRMVQRLRGRAPH